MAISLDKINEGTIDGCPSNFVPWYDEDYDGIEDHIDQCPSLRENYNLFQDEDGCPDLSPDTDAGIADSDGDGFPDYLDLCPTQPETYNAIYALATNLLDPIIFLQCLILLSKLVCVFFLKGFFFVIAQITFRNLNLLIASFEIVK